MLDKRKERKVFLNTLKERGLRITTEGTIVNPIERKFKTIYEEIIWLINESPTYLTVGEMSAYLGVKHKSVSKAITKLYRDDKDKTDYLRRIQKDRKYAYRADIPKNLDIPDAFNVIKDLSNRKHNTGTGKTQSSSSTIPTRDTLSTIRDLLDSGDYELVIRRNTSA